MSGRFEVDALKANDWDKVDDGEARRGDELDCGDGRRRENYLKAGLDVVRVAAVVGSGGWGEKRPPSPRLDGTTLAHSADRKTGIPQRRTLCIARQHWSKR